MKRITQIGALAVALLLGAAGNPVYVRAVGEQQKNIMVAEVSPEAADSASKEYLLIYNPNTEEVDVSGWMIQYRSASYKAGDTKGWSTRAILGCESNKVTDCSRPDEVTILPGESLRLSSYETGDGFLPLVAGMSTVGGVVRLVRPTDDVNSMVVHDKVGYGSAADFEGNAGAPAPAAGHSIVRVLNGEGAYVDTNQNGADFMIQPEEDDGSDNPPPSAPEPPSPDVPSTSYFDVEVSEVLPDPTSPKTDSADEFIELYNPHSEPVNLNGYVLKTGANWNYKYVLPDITLAPYEYLMLSAAQTHLTLSNSGAGVRLYDPTGRLIFEVPTYGKAKPGQSWVRDAQGQWVWSAKVTPDAQNIVEVMAAQPKASSTKKSPATKPTSTKKASTPKTSAVKGVSTVAAQPAQASSGENHAGMWALGAAVALGVGYAIFEYRQDMLNFVRRRWEAVKGVFGK